MVKEGVRRVAFVIFRLWLVWLSLLSRAGAVEEREIQFAVEGLYGLTYIDAGTHSGGGGAVQLAYGLTDSLALQLTGVAMGRRGGVRANMFTREQWGPVHCVTCSRSLSP